MLKLPKKKLFALAVLLILLAALLAGVYLVQQRQIVEKKAAQPTASLSFGITSFENLSSGDPVSTTVILNPGNQKVVSVDLAISFTKEVLELLGVEPTAKTNTSFKTFTPIVSQTDCTFNLDIAGANQTGRLEFGAVTFDCETALGCSPDQPDCARPTPNPAGQIINPLAWLHFRVRDNALPGSTAIIEFYYNPSEPTKDSNVIPCVCDPSHTDTCICPTQPGGTVDDILLPPTSVVSVSVAGQATPTPASSHCLPLGDIDCSGKVNSLDFSYLIAHYNTSDPLADLDDSGKVNALDVSVLLSNFGKTR